MVAWNKGLRKEFSECYVRVTESGCWIWISGYDRNGYGKMTANKMAHRHSYEIYKGKIPPGIFVLHRCDVTSCVNPDHLFLGTNKDNCIDRSNKGRQCRGEKQRASKLKNTDIPAIRDMAGSYCSIARKYNVTPRVISLMKRNLAWTHI